MENLDIIRKEIDDTYQQALIHIRRDDKPTALSITKKLIEKYPDNPWAMDAHADVLYANNKLEEARDTYKKILDTNKGWINTEKKYAQVVLDIANKQHSFEHLIKEMSISEMITPAGAKRSSGLAAFASLICPGLGQFANGQTTKGVVFFLITVILWVAVFTSNAIIFSRTQFFITAIGWVIIIALIITYLTAIIDASMNTPKDIPMQPQQRPKPPVDLPFE